MRIERAVLIERTIHEAVREFENETAGSECGISSSDRNHIGAAALVRDGTCETLEQAWAEMPEAIRLVMAGRRLFAEVS